VELEVEVQQEIMAHQDLLQLELLELLIQVVELVVVEKMIMEQLQLAVQA
jgi:hypothetical protein